MARKNFFELMEREVNFQDEYEKIENAIINDNLYGSLDDVIEKVWCGIKKVDILFSRIS